jgi:hypothetical protein
LYVRVYDAVGVAPPEMVIAKMTVQPILHAAGIELDWRECGRSASTSEGPTCEQLIDRAVVVMRIAATGLHPNESALGYSLIDPSHHRGTLVTIFANRVERMAARAHVDAGTLLGRTMAHEIGHVLLGTSQHSSTGLMRGHWYDHELQRNLAADWVLSPDEALRMRRGLILRSTTHELADGVVASR